MLYKEFNTEAFSSWEHFGIVIPPLSKIKNKLKLGMKSGLIYFVPVIFGTYAVKLSSIPM